MDDSTNKAGPPCTSLKTNSINVEQDDILSIDELGNKRSKLIWPIKCATTGDRVKVTSAILNNMGFVEPKKLGFSWATCDLGENLPASCGSECFAQLDMENLDRDLPGERGCNFFMSMINDFPEDPSLRELPSFIGGVKAFHTNIYSTLTKTNGLESALKAIYESGIDMFQYKRLLFPIFYEGQFSLFVVSNGAHVIKSYCCHQNDVLRRGDLFTGGIHLDPSGKHNTKVISDHIKGLLNHAWSRSHREVMPIDPFQEMLVALPCVPMQVKQDKSCIYVCMFALGIYKTRNKDHTSQHFWDNMGKVVTENDNFSFGPQKADTFESNWRLTLMSLHSLSHSAGGIANPQRTTITSRKTTKVKKRAEGKTEGRLKTEGLPMPLSSLLNPSKTENCRGAKVNKQQTEHGQVVTKRSADTKEIERRRRKCERVHKYAMTETIPKLQKEGKVLKKEHQKLIKFWDGDYDGTFRDALQLTTPASITCQHDKKQEFMGVVVSLRGEFPQWSLHTVPVTHIQIVEPVYYDTYIAKKLTGWMLFKGHSVPVAVVRCGNETKLLSKLAVSPCVHSQARQKNAPDRLSSDEAGRLTWTKENVTSSKSPHSTCSDRHFDTVYYGSFVNSDGRYCAKDPKLQQLLRRGKYEDAVQESLKLKGRERDSHGKPVGRSGDEKSYAELKNDPIAQKRLAASILFETLKGERHLEYISPRSPPPSATTARRSRRSLPTSNRSSLFNYKKRSSSPKSTTVTKWPKKVKIQCAQEGCTKNQCGMYYPFCSSHKKKKKICTECGKSEARRTGGLCVPCFKKRFPNEEELRKARMCVECNVRVSRQIGGRCQDCVSMCGRKRTKTEKAVEDTIGADAVDGTEVACVLSSEVVLQGGI